MSSILFFPLHKSPSRGMLANPCLTSSIMAGSSHYHPCCFYYTSTSSALFKINMLRYFFMFAPVSLDACRNTEPVNQVCCMVARWEFSVFLFPFPPDFPALTTHSLCSLTFWAVYLVLVRNRTQQSEMPAQKGSRCVTNNQDVRQCKRMRF